jgi:hypothetical protein
MRSIILCLALQLAAPIAAMQMHSLDSFALPAVTEVASLSVGAIQDSPPSNPPSNPPADKPSTDVNVEVQHDDGGTLGVSPVWLAIGGLGLLVLIVLIVMAVRNKSGETTVVRQ